MTVEGATELREQIFHTQSHWMRPVTTECSVSVSLATTEHNHDPGVWPDSFSLFSDPLGQPSHAYQDFHGSLYRINTFGQ